MSIILLGFTYAINASELSINELFEHGKKNNFELKQKEEALKAIEREMAVLQANLDWQLGFSSNISYNSAGPTYKSSLPLEEGEIATLSLQGGKTTISGISISSELSLTETDPLSFENLDEKYRFSLNISKRLYPIIPDNTEKNFMQANNRYLIAEAEFKQLQKQKEVDWLESYLNIFRLQQQLKYANEGLKLAHKNLEQVKGKQKIGEAGKEQLLMAEISVKEAKLQQDQLKNNLSQARDSMLLELGLNNNQDMVFTVGEISKYIVELKKREFITDDLTNMAELVRLLKKNNIQLRKLQYDIDYAENELKWQKREDGIKVDASTAYNYNGAASGDKNSYSINLGLSYDFMDGGQQELAMTGIERKIKNLKDQYQNTLEKLKIQLKGLLNQQKTNQLKVATKKTALEKAQLELKLYQKQLENGLLSEIQYQQNKLEVLQDEMDYKLARDSLLISKLKLALFLGIY